MKQLRLPDLFKFQDIPVAVACGMGVNTVAMLIELARRGQRPDLILFADTGAEKQGTYDYEPLFAEWLKREGFPPIITVRYRAKIFRHWPPYYTLEDNCNTNGTLPGLVFGKKSCSIKWKQAPQHEYIRAWRPALKAWSAGAKVMKLIGLDAGPADNRRRNHVGDDENDDYDYRYPLIAWCWDRGRCIVEIKRAGLPVPPKSACFFCPAMKPHEVEELTKDHLQRIVAMEARAKPRLLNREGLWIKTVKGCRGAIPRPGSMTQFILERELLPKEEVEHIQQTTPTEIVSFQRGYAQALAEGRAEEFLEANGHRDHRQVPSLPHGAEK